MVNYKLKLNGGIMCVYQSNQVDNEKTIQETCAETISELLKKHCISATVKGLQDDGGTWVEIDLVDPNIHHIEYISKIRSKFEATLEYERKDRKRSVNQLPQVDYVAVNVKYTKKFKNKVWNWIQSEFKDDMGSLPSSYEQLDQYHVGRTSRISAFKMIDYALLNRLQNISFWKNAH